VAGVLLDLVPDLVDPASPAASSSSSLGRSSDSPPAGHGGEGLGIRFDPACLAEPGLVGLGASRFLGKRGVPRLL
jgi:hypothetical protein